MRRKRQISVRFTDAEWEAITAAAAAEKRSLANWILIAVDERLKGMKGEA